MIDDIPELLDWIAATADSGSPEFSRPAAEKHATERLHDGFDLAQVVAELSLLRSSVIQLWKMKIGESLQLDDLAALEVSIDACIAAAVDRYTEFFQQLRKAKDRAVSDLRERERQLRAIADNIPQLTWMADVSGSAFWFNERWFDYTGTAASEMKGAGWQSVVHPEHRERVVAAISTAIARGEVWEDMFPLRGHNGYFRWFLTRAVPVRELDGTVDRWFISSSDMHKRRFLDQATAILSSALDYNVTLERLAQAAVPEIADCCLVDLVEDDQLRRVASAGVQPSGEVLDPAKVIRAPMVSRGRAIGTITLIISDSKRRYQLSDVTVAMELGRRAAVAVDNARLYAEGQAAVRVREEVLAIVSHDLRGPLGAIDLAASMLLQAHGSDPRARKQLDLVRLCASRMGHMINDLLDLASINAGRLALVPNHEDAEAIMAEVLDVHEPLAAERGISITRDVELVGMQLYCDRNRVAQVFGNILGNAIKFCRPGDVIHVRGLREGSRARFSVSDTGPGIAAEDLAHVFKPYWSASKSQSKGTGLGLYISRAIVEAHGGELAADSKEGEGASFDWTLPIIDPSSSSEP